MPLIDPHLDRILILDFGSQYTQLIARRVREAGVYCEIYAHDVDDVHIRSFTPRGIILSGGPSSVTERTTPRASSAVFELAVPVLGICYGMQVMADQLGGGVEMSDHREYGHARVRITGSSAIFNRLTTAEQELDVWMSHGDRVSRPPEGFHIIASSTNAPMCAIADEKRKYFGLQFHPEVTHTDCGEQLLSNFVHDICGCASDWNAANIIEDLVSDVRQKVGRDHVILGLSGGVDSSVVAALLQRAIGTQLTCIFVDNGLLRLNEAEQVMNTFAEHLGVHVIQVQAQRRFLDALQGIDDPEEKRKTIGRVFIEVFEAEAAKIDDAHWLAQGTIYPDVIESAGAKTGKATVIKSHHNVGGIPDWLGLKLLEPLRELFKDEVRNIGLQLGLPEKLVFRHPFPGPGLGVRILGEVRESYADILRQADAIYMQELERHDLYRKVSQAFAVFLPVRSVGVVGDYRAYEFVIALRAVETIDFMTANWAQLPYEVLATISNRIINEVRGVSRVTYDISGKPPATIEWE